MEATMGLISKTPKQEVKKSAQIQVKALTDKSVTLSWLPVEPT